MKRLKKPYRYRSEFENRERYLSDKERKIIEINNYLFGDGWLSDMDYDVDLLKRISDKIDLDHWDGNFNMKSLIKAGVPYKHLMPYSTKKEIAEYLDYVDSHLKSHVRYCLSPYVFGRYRTYMARGQDVGDIHLRWFETSIYFLSSGHSRDLDLLIKIEEIEEKYNIVDFMGLMGKMTCDFIIDNIDKLKKVEKVRLDNGLVVDLHRHELTTFVDDLHELLSLCDFKKKRISWKKFYKLARPRYIASLEKSTLDLHLEEFPLKIESESIRQITSSQDLITEGEVMSHCVGSFVDDCRAGKSYIFHMDNGTEYGCTFEIVPIEYYDVHIHKDVKYGITQIRGKRNANLDNTIGELIEYLGEEVKEVMHDEIYTRVIDMTGRVVSYVTDMSGIFSGATSFNQDIGRALADVTVFSGYPQEV